METAPPKRCLPPRLTRTSEFRRLKRAGKRHRHGFLLMFVQTASRPRPRSPASGLPGYKTTGRVGFTVPERVIKKAVKRNRVRRLLKEAVRLWWSDILPGRDLLLVVNGAPRHDHAWFVEGLFLELLLRAELLTPEGRKRAKDRLGSLPPEFGFSAQWGGER